MTMQLNYNAKLFSRCDPEEIRNLSKIVFVEGHLDRIDDLIQVLLPLANIVYYKYIRYYDDREYAKEDLISESIAILYQDMKLRWDKYLNVEYYYDYFSTSMKNIMISLVHPLHNYYSTDELDPDSQIKVSEEYYDVYEQIEVKMLLDSINKEIVNIAERLLKCRRVNTKLLMNILHTKYLDKEDLCSLRSRVKVIGIPHTLFNFYEEHVDYVYSLAYNYQYAILGGRDKMIDRISHTIDRFEDITYRMLATEYYDSIIPEIYAEFGSEIANKFVRTFSGRTVHVPDYKDFNDHLLGGLILSLADGDKSNLYRVAEEYKIPYRTLARIYDKAFKYSQT